MPRRGIFVRFKALWKRAGKLGCLKPSQEGVFARI